MSVDEQLETEGVGWEGDLDSMRSTRSWYRGGSFRLVVPVLHHDRDFGRLSRYTSLRMVVI